LSAVWLRLGRDSHVHPVGHTSRAPRQLQTIDQASLILHLTKNDGSSPSSASSALDPRILVEHLCRGAR